VVDYRRSQIGRLANVEVAYESPLTAGEVVEYGFDHVAVATGSHWRRDGVARAHLRPIPLAAGMQVLTPDDMMAGVRPRGERVVLFDDDHYYMGGVLAELLVAEGHSVTLVTPESLVSSWTANTMEQPRIQRRLIELGVTVVVSHAVSSAAADAVRVACGFSGRERELACDALVLVTARLPDEALMLELDGRVASLRAVGDALSPGTIAAAVWDGRRYAEELDAPTGDDDLPPFRREVVGLAPRLPA